MGLWLAFFSLAALVIWAGESDPISLDTELA